MGFRGVVERVAQARREFGQRHRVELAVPGDLAVQSEEDPDRLTLVGVSLY
jgi:hypothetical protein